MNKLFSRQDWKKLIHASQVIAAKFGGRVHCSQKYTRLRVDFSVADLSIAEMMALATIGELIELVSEFPEGYLERIDAPDLEEIVSIDPGVLGGTPVFKGTRVPLAVLFDNLADGMSLDDILDAYPTMPHNLAKRALETAKFLVR